MLSCPPAMTISASPALIACAARCVAFSPDPQTLLIVIAGTIFGMPAMMDAWRAGFWPAAAESTCPIKTSLTNSGLTPVLASSAAITFAPSSVAGILPIVPPNFPTPVRKAATITTSSILKSPTRKFRTALLPTAGLPDSGTREGAVYARVLNLVEAKTDIGNALAVLQERRHDLTLGRV